MRRAVSFRRRAALAPLLLALMIPALMTTLVQAAPAAHRIGVLQFAQHPALDSAREGFVAELRKAGLKPGRDFILDVENAQGDISTARAIADKFVSDRVDLILAIATPAAQACARVTRSIPILITAVTDPVAAGLVKALDRPGTNVTGTSDLTPVSAQLKLLRLIDPGVRRVGILFNPGESNSQSQVATAEQAARDLRMDLIKAPVTGTSEILQVAESLVGRVEALYVPTDNTVVAGIESVVKVANAHHIPFVAGEESCVQRGALATVGINYFNLGAQTGLMALKVLKGANPAAIAIEYQKKLRTVVNLRAAAAIGITLPKSILDEAELIR